MQPNPPVHARQVVPLIKLMQHNCVAMAEQLVQHSMQALGINVLQQALPCPAHAAGEVQFAADLLHMQSWLHQHSRHLLDDHGIQCMTEAPATYPGRCPAATCAADDVAGTNLLWLRCC